MDNQTNCGEKSLGKKKWFTPLFICLMVMLFGVVWACVFFFGVYKASKMPLVFRSTAIIELKGNDKDPSYVLTQQAMLQSRQLAGKVIRANGLNVSLSSPDPILNQSICFRPTFRDSLAYNNSRISMYEKGLTVKNISTGSHVYNPVSYRFEFTHPDTFKILNGAGFIGSGYLGRQTIPTSSSSNDEVRFTLVPTEDFALKAGDVVRISIVPEAAVVPEFLNSLSVETIGDGTHNSNLLRVSFRAESPFLAKKVVDSLLNLYLDDLLTKQNMGEWSKDYLAHNLANKLHLVDDSSKKILSDELSGFFAIQSCTIVEAPSMPLAPISPTMERIVASSAITAFVFAIFFVGLPGFIFLMVRWRRNQTAK